MLSSRIWNIYNDIGSTACQAGDYDLAVRMFTMAIDTCAKTSMQGPKVKSLIGLADALIMQRHTDEAAKMYNRAVNIFARIGTPERSDKRMLAHALEKLGYLRELEDKQEEALRLLERSVRVTEQAVGVKDPSLIHRLLKISSFHIRFGNSAASLECFNRVKQIRALEAHHKSNQLESGTEETGEPQLQLPCISISATGFHNYPQGMVSLGLTGPAG